MPLEPIPMTAPLTIRPATADDAELILRFITDLAIYEKAEHEVKTDAAGIENSLFAEGSTAHGLICELDGQPIGYAVYFFNYSTWLGRHGLYLEDLYVSPEARGLGVGKALLDAGITWATEHPTVRKLSLSVFDDNAAAVRLYEGRGFVVEGRRPLEYREDAGSLRGDILMARAT